ncbi:plasmid pRiA4b ORF-3 family protein [Puia sp. P3]|uniref:plasmid pRiA4b ORF-3 family protein n=1 Tax=Puia sp. P3 TaxID=3423952 RepID=UPI003D67A20E
MISHFYIELEDSSPLVWRRIVVPAEYTLYKLHMAFQGAFGWENSHLFQFCEKDLTDATGYGVPYGLDTDTEIIDARRTKISRIFKKPGDQYYYIYDFGDYWRHRVTFEKKEAKEMSSPWCIGGAGACPPEDVGGMHGYQEMVKMLKISGDKELKEYREWLGLVKGEKWDADFCSIREVNKRLCLLE